MTKNWFRLACKSQEVQLLGTLNGGQSFRWKLLNDTRWIGVLLGRVWVLKQEPDYISYQIYEKEHELPESEDFYNNILSNYFQLDLDLKQCFKDWCEKDPIFKKATGQFYGIRILKQDLVENIFSFICSSNNNISRITGMIEKMCTLYGEKICVIDGRSYYSFPTIAALSPSEVGDVLKRESFGYRAKYINQTAKIIIEMGGEEWLNTLKKLPYEESKEQLMILTGIGPKVADCICLMSLGHLGAIPVDTHVYQIARNFYMPKLPKQKTVTTKLYKEIGEHFRELYGPLAGWAQTVLFCADLKKLH